MRLARTAAPLPRVALWERTKIWSAGLEPAISDARSRWGGRAPLRPVDPSTSSPAGLEPATRGVEALCSSAELRGDRRPWNRTTLHRRIRAAPAQPARRRHLAGRIRTSVPHPRKVALGSAELRRGALSAGVEPASPGRQPSRATRRVREHGWSPGESNPARVDASHHPGHQEPHGATAGTRTRSAALATPCASDLTPRSHRGAPRAGFEPASPV
jgi:hypothetical protein